MPHRLHTPGWIPLACERPAVNAEIEVLHSGYGRPEHQITDTATVHPRWGICPHARDGGHGKQSTITHWRPQA